MVIKMVQLNEVKKTNREKVKKMNSEKKTETIFEDVKINVKIKLSFIWVALLFFYLYNDVFTLLQPGINTDLYGFPVSSIAG
jgi:hypothetical protein